MTVEQLQNWIAAGLKDQSFAASSELLLLSDGKVRGVGTLSVVASSSDLASGPALVAKTRLVLIGDRGGCL
jgi:hypothetical protein